MIRNCLITICIILFVSNVYGQTGLSAKDSTRLARLEKQIVRAELNLSKANRAFQEADSLLQIGKVMVDEGKEQDKALEAEGKMMDRNYAVNRKPIEKLTKSKNKVEVRKAKAEIKILDNQYKADTKHFLNQKKAIIKKISTGKVNVAKGKAYRKNATVDVKRTTKALNDAQKAYDEAKSI